MLIGFHVSARYSCQLSMELEYSPQIFEKYSNNKFHDNAPTGSRVAPYGQTYVRTDRHEEAVVAFRTFANAPKKRWISLCFHESFVYIWIYFLFHADFKHFS